MHLPRGPFDWTCPVTGEKQVAYLQKNLYGIPPAPRTFSKGVHKFHCSIGFSSCIVESSLFARIDEHGNEVQCGMYVDEGYGGASDMDRALWYRDKLKTKYDITWEFEWKNMLGFGVEDEPDKPLAFTANKYVRGMMDKYLPGELKQERKTASRESIMSLSAIKLPELGSSEDITMKAMQELGRSLVGGLGHLARGRFDIVFDHAIAAQSMARMSYEATEAAKEVLRYAASKEMRIEYPSTMGKKPYRHAPSPYREPIRPYDEEIDFELYGIGDMGMRKMETSGSKPMGGYAVMYGGGALEAKSFRFHTVITDSTSGETVVASRLGNRLLFYRRVKSFLGRPPQAPTPLFTDNDGTWYVARDATGTTRMTYVINHVKMIQQLETDSETRAFQCDTALNPADCLATWRDPATRLRHYTFIMGDPAKARRLWVESAAFKSWKQKKISPVPSKPVDMEGIKTADKGALAIMAPTQPTPSFLSRLAARAYDGLVTDPMVANNESCFTVMDTEPFAREHGYSHFLTVPRKFILDCNQAILTVADLDILHDQAQHVIMQHLMSLNVSFDVTQLWTGFHVPPHASVPWLHMHVLYPKDIVIKPPMGHRWTKPRFISTQELRLKIA